MFVLDYKTKIPIYEQIQDQVISFIALGLFKPNEQLPAVRQLATDLGVNPNTVAKAYQQLEHLGYIVSQTGRGSFISDNRSSIELLKQEYFNQFELVINKLQSLNVPYPQVNELLLSLYKEEESL